MFDMLKARGMLTAHAIDQAVAKGDIYISEYDPKNLNPNSYNIKTGETVTVYQNIQAIDLKNPNTYKQTETFDIDELKGFTLRPGLVYLVPTHETIGALKYIPMITGRSSMGRLGISVHQEAGFGDIGYQGIWTMQLKVTYPTIIYPNMPIAQVYFFTPCGKISAMYNGRYQGSSKAIPSRFCYTQDE